MSKTMYIFDPLASSASDSLVYKDILMIGFRKEFSLSTYHY